MMGLGDSHLAHYLRSRRWSPPASAQQAIESELYKAWWFYGVELHPGVEKKGIFPDEMPLPARMLLRHCDLRGADCLDVGSMEGLVPVLMKKQGARKVLATDFSFHCYAKLTALAKLHRVDIDFTRIGLLYDLATKLSKPGQRGFDLINLSGVLYHVFSPLHVMAGLRPLLRKNGLMIVSTNVIERNNCSMEFNDRGKLQREANTFWYLSTKMFEYMLRYFQLEPLDFIYYRYPNKDQVRFLSGGENAGYLSVVCRALSDRGACFEDEWLLRSIKSAWEYRLCDQKLLDSQDVSGISYRRARAGLDVAAAIGCEPALEGAPSLRDSHFLKLADAD